MVSPGNFRGLFFTFFQKSNEIIGENKSHFSNQPPVFGPEMLLQKPWFRTKNYQPSNLSYQPLSSGGKSKPFPPLLNQHRRKVPGDGQVGNHNYPGKVRSVLNYTRGLIFLLLPSLKAEEREGPKNLRKQKEMERYQSSISCFKRNQIFKNTKPGSKSKE